MCKVDVLNADEYEKIKGTKKEWHYIDIHKFEDNVRKNERKKIQREREKNRQYINYCIYRFSKKFFQKTTGCFTLSSIMFLIKMSTNSNLFVKICIYLIALIVVPISLRIIFTKRILFK